MKTTRERAEERRAEKLEAIREQVDSGRLIIREMTSEERLKYAPRPDGYSQKSRRYQRGN